MINIIYKLKTSAYIIFIFVNFSCKKNYTVDEYLQLADSSVLSISIVADSLEVPWDMQYNQDNHTLIYSEIKGRISSLDLHTGSKKELYQISEVYHKRTLGLLGIVIYPKINTHPYIFVSYTTKRNDSIYSRLERFTLKDDTLMSRKLFLEIPGSSGHNGSRLSVSKDGKLLWATGDAHSKTFAQDSTSLNGKILRLNVDGTVPKDNPIKNSYVYAWGFRNMQGLAVSNNGDIYTSEHGDAIEDEINLIEPLRNYGWPKIEGMHDLQKETDYAKLKNTKEPIRSWTPVIAPAGLAYYNSDAIPAWKNSLLLTTLKSQTLRVLKLNANGQEILSEQIFLENHYGRLRAVTVLPNGDVYIATSNRDWNPQLGFPKKGDDKILRITKVQKAKKTPLKAKTVAMKEVQTGKMLYNSFCSSCHKADGSGLGKVFPTLKNSKKVNTNKKVLIDIFLNGVSIEGKNEQMPSFKFLSDEESAKILTYIRTSWGNNSAEIVPEEIKQHRK